MRRSLLVAVALLGCDPVLIVRGDVRSIPESASATGDVYASAKPISGAKISLSCPERPSRELATTDASGRFEYATVGLLDVECVVEVRADGYQPQRILVGEVCVHETGLMCHFMRVQAELVPSAASSIE